VWHSLRRLALLARPLIAARRSRLLLRGPSFTTALRPDARDREKPPCARHSLEVVQSSIPELNPGAGHQVLHGAGDQNLSRGGDGCHPGGGVDGDAADTMSALPQLDLPGVQSGADVARERTDRFLDRPGGTDSAPRSIERGQDSVSGGLDEPPLVPSDLVSSDLVVSLEYCFHRRSPMEAARSVEFTISVKSTVARTRSGTAPPGIRLRNASMRSRISPACSVTRTPSVPGSSTSLASGMCSAR